MPDYVVEAKKTGRPPKLVADEGTLGLIEALGKVGCTLDEVAQVLSVSVPTLVSFLSSYKKKMGGEAPDPFQRGKVLCKISLRRKQMALADKSATMCIFLGKQYLGQRDFVEVTNEYGPLKAAATAAENRVRVAELNERLGYRMPPEADPRRRLPGIEDATNLTAERKS